MSDNSERLRRNDKSRNKAAHHTEPWSAGDIEFLLGFWPGACGVPAKEAEVAEALGRTIEACRQYYYEEVSGHHNGVCSSPRTTNNTPEYIGAFDDPEDRWWSPQQEG